MSPVFWATLIVTEPPDETLMGKTTQAPLTKGPMVNDLGPEPSFTVIVSLRFLLSQSTA